MLQLLTTYTEASTLVAEASEAFDAQVNTASVENVATVVKTATSSTRVKPIEEGSIRLHLLKCRRNSTRKSRFVDLGRVAEPSDGSQWPTDTVNFRESSSR